ncbi:hypothetical protein ACRRTK_003126 [Alexandromys fortis]
MPRFSRIVLNFLPPVVGESLGEGRLLTAAIGGSTPLMGQHGVVDSCAPLALTNDGCSAELKSLVKEDAWQGQQGFDDGGGLPMRMQHWARRLEQEIDGVMRIFGGMQQLREVSQIALSYTSLDAIAPPQPLPIFPCVVHESVDPKHSASSTAHGTEGGLLSPFSTLPHQHHIVPMLGGE